MTISKLLYIMSGFIALVLGFIGIVLPLVPTTPLVLLACFCFAKGSDRLHRWLRNTWLYRRYICGFSKSKAMPLKAKLSVCVAASLLMFFPFVFAPFWVVRAVIFSVLAYKWYFFMFKIKTTARQTVMSTKRSEV